MRKYLLAAAAVVAVASPAMARNGQPYVGIEGGILFPKDSNQNLFVDYTSTQTPTSPAAVFPVDTTYLNSIDLNYKRGYDIDAIAGYDFGIFRLEGELGRKRTKVGSFSVNSTNLAAINTALNRPSAAPDPGAPGLVPLTSANFVENKRITVNSIMVNALIDLGNENGLSFYAGGGAGRAFFSSGPFRDSSWAYQGIAGVRFAVSQNLDLGIKYRYFRANSVDLSDQTQLVQGNADRTVIGTTTVDRTTTAVLFTDFKRKFKSHSLLASLTYNFGGPVAEVVAAPPPPPPAPIAAPATQTCADGSVILATDACPAPPPPPAPTPAPERG